MSETRIHLKQLLAHPRTEHNRFKKLADCHRNPFKAQFMLVGSKIDIKKEKKLTWKPNLGPDSFFYFFNTARFWQAVGDGKQKEGGNP